MVKMLNVIFHPYAFSFYGFILFFALDLYFPSETKVNWKAVLLTGLVIAILFVISIPFTVSEAAKTSQLLLIGVPIAFIGGILSAFISMMVFAPVKKYMKRQAS